MYKYIVTLSLLFSSLQVFGQKGQTVVLDGIIMDISQSIDTNYSPIHREYTVFMEKNSFTSNTILHFSFGQEKDASRQNLNVLDHIKITTALVPVKEQLTNLVCFSLKKQKNFQRILVFNKNVSPDLALKQLSGKDIYFLEGMDSSRGKNYFYSTGPKFILNFFSQASMLSFEKVIKKDPLVYEIYPPHWEIQKD